MITITTTSYKWVDEVKEALSKSEGEGMKVLLLSQEETNGLLGLVNCLIKEPGGNNLR